MTNEIRKTIAGGLVALAMASSAYCQDKPASSYEKLSAPIASYELSQERTKRLRSLEECENKKILESVKRIEHPFLVYGGALVAAWALALRFASSSKIKRKEDEELIPILEENGYKLHDSPVGGPGYPVIYKFGRPLFSGEGEQFFALINIHGRSYWRPDQDGYHLVLLDRVKRKTHLVDSSGTRRIHFNGYFNFKPIAISHNWKDNEVLVCYEKRNENYKEKKIKGVDLGETK